MKISEVILAAEKLKEECDYLIEQTDFDDCGFGKVERCLTMDEKFMKERLASSFYWLKRFCDEINYLKRPIKADGLLRKNQRGRYEIKEREYTSGCIIEFLAYDDFDECEKWILSRVEHNGEDYYIVSQPTLPLDGLRVRIR